jgi:hypothetical protein
VGGDGGRERVEGGVMGIRIGGSSLWCTVLLRANVRQASVQICISCTIFSGPVLRARFSFYQSIRLVLAWE